MDTVISSPICSSRRHHRRAQGPWCKWWRAQRVTIGVELLHDPPLVFLDEPTSGLDSFQAQSVMETLRNLATNGHTVVCSIHQPRSSIYAMVDSLLLLAGGRCVYYGPSGSTCHSYFAGLSTQCLTI